MSAEYRQKLLNWLTSMMVLMLVQSAALAWTWVWLLRAQSQNTFGGWLPYTMAYRMGAVLEIFIVGFVLAAFWHFFDFLRIQTRNPVSRFKQDALEQRLQVLGQK